MTETVDIEALMAAARDRGPAARSRLFALLGQLFLQRGAALPQNERRGFAELLALLRPQADPETRLELAYATAETAQAPRELALLLAEDEIEVASLVLFGARALGVAELLALAKHADRALVIAERRFLPMVVADSLMRHGDRELARALLKNESARLSIPALAEAIELARDDEDLQQRIAERPELLEDMAIDMLEWAASPVRERLIERFDLGSLGDPSERWLRASLGIGGENGPDPNSESWGVPGEPGGGTPDVTYRAVTSRDPSGPAPDPRFRLSPRLVIEGLRRGEAARAEAMLAQMARLPVGLLRRLSQDPAVDDASGTNMVLAARAIGMAREEFATIYLLWRKAQSPEGLVAAGDLGAALDRFDTLPLDRVEAEAALLRSQARPEEELSLGEVLPTVAATGD